MYGTCIAWQTYTAQFCNRIQLYLIILDILMIGKKQESKLVNGMTNFSKTCMVESYAVLHACIYNSNHILYMYIVSNGYQLINRFLRSKLYLQFKINKSDILVTLHNA